MIEMTIESVRVNVMNYQRVVILKEKDADRYLPIWIGAPEADAIVVQLQEVPVARPLTHDLMNAMLSALGAAVDSVVVNDLNHDTFYARVMLKVEGKSLEIDSRPSDALALAVRTRAPIFAEEAVLAKAGVVMDPETGKFQAKTPEPGVQVNEEERKRLSAFTDFINGLDLDDFEKKGTQG